MRTLGKALGRLLLLLALLVAGMALFGPREPAPLTASFDPRKFGEGVQVYFESVESAYADITPGVEKRVIWQDGFKEQRTPYAVLYVHGFSATSEEIRPIPDRIADALGANLVYTRLAGHGRGSQPMAEATVADWMADMAEALAAARAVGERVIVISTSTGGTLSAAAMLDDTMGAQVAALIFVSPNFGINGTGAGALTWPGIRWWGPLLLGQTRSWEPANAAQATYWTSTYPSVAVMPMAALVKAVMAQDFSAMRAPALFWYAEADQVVRPDRTAAFAQGWGGPSTTHLVAAGTGTDASNHVIAGDIMAPAATDDTVNTMLGWLAQQGIN